MGSVTRPPGLGARGRRRRRSRTFVREGSGVMLERPRPHLHQSLRPVRLAPRGRARRGDWDGTKDLILKGRDWIVERDQGIGLARPRRRRLPDRPQMVVHAQEQRPAVLSRRQRRRERARHLQGPRHHPQRSAQAGRGLPARRRRDGRARRATSISAASSTTRRCASRPRSTRPTRPASSARTPAARATISSSISIAAPAPISAARRRRCWKASRARRASRA